MSLICPDALMLLSSANEGDTEGDIAEMGVRLANEVNDFIQDNCSDSLGRLSFVAHSLGGIITRAALTAPAMEPYLCKCYTYMSLATPHCGYMFSANSLFNTGNSRRAICIY